MDSAFMVVLIYFFSLFLLFFPAWLESNFGSTVTFETLLFYIQCGAEGITGTDLPVLYGFMQKNFIKPILIITVLSMLFYVNRNGLPISTIIKITKNFISILHRHLTNKSIAFILLVITSILFLFRTGAPSFLNQWFGKDYFTALYIKPDLARFSNPKNKKNLILIYVESLEANLRNKNIHGKNQIEEIDNLPGERVPQFHPAPGTGWSIAGMVSSQCSVPLRPCYGNSIDKLNGSFLPNIVCLGDVLNKQGYKQYYLVGSDAKFAGISKFYQNHGYDEVLGKDEWKSKGLDQDLFTGWGEGINDFVVFEEAMKIIDSNIKANQPFNLTLITVDTHASDGVPSPNCTIEENNSGFRGAFRCASRTIANFINDLDSRKILDNTIVIIMGDHPFMNNSKQSRYFPDPRYIYFKIIDKNSTKKIRRHTMTHFDVAPSILDLLELNQDSCCKFGLGVSLFAEMDEVAYNRHLKLVTNGNILNYSQTYNSFWSQKKPE